MNPLPHPSQPALPTIQTRHELDAVVENVVQLQLARAALERDQEQEIAGVRQKFRGPLAELDRYLLLETTWVENWARSNADAFPDDARSLACTHATLGFRVSPARVDRASRKWTWTEIASKLGDIAWGRRYLRQPAPEVNKEALLADRAELDPAELRKCGVKIVQEERFFIAPHGPTTLGSGTVSENEWREAA
jgi:phage host-nuclease inhibitor protein Gam